MQATSITIKDPSAKPNKAATDRRPSVVVMNLFHTGLGIARQLYGTEVRVVGLSANRDAYGNFTRLCEVRFAPDSRDQPERLAEFLLRAAIELDGAVIFPTRDADIFFLDRYRSVLERSYRLAIPPSQSLNEMMDKSAVAATAAKAHIPTPRTVAVRRSSELHEAAGAVGFPCVVKPIKSAHWREGDNWNVVANRKAFRVLTLAELQREYHQVSRAHQEILLQEWIPGPNDQLAIWAGYARRGEDPLGYFTARKILQCPDDFGTGCIVKSESIPELIEPSLKLCRALDYTGIAEIEYKFDARDQQFKLIEINPRHWDWHELGRASDVNLTWAAYCHMTGRQVQPSQPTAHSAKWLAEDAFLMHILSGIYHRQPGALKQWRNTGGKTIYGIFSWNDPMPLLRHCVAGIAPRLTREVIKKMRGHGSIQNASRTCKGIS